MIIPWLATIATNRNRAIGLADRCTFVEGPRLWVRGKLEYFLGLFRKGRPRRDRAPKPPGLRPSPDAYALDRRGRGPWRHDRAHEPEPGHAGRHGTKPIGVKV